MKYNIIANFFGKFWSVTSTFLFIPLYINYLGFDSYTIISFTILVAGMLAIMDSGLSSTLSRELSRSDITFNEKNEKYNALEFIFILIILLCLFLLNIFTLTIVKNFMITENFSNDDLELFIRIFSLDMVSQMLFRFYLGGLQGLENQVLANIFQVLWGIFRNGFVILVLLIEPSLEMYFIWQASVSLLFVIIIRASLQKKMNQNVFNFNPFVNLRVLNSVWRFSLGMFLISFVAAINFQLDKLIITKYISIETLGYYTLATSICVGITMLINPITTALLPRFTSLYSINKGNEAVILFEKSIFYIFVIVFSFAFNIVLNSESVFWIWTGNIEIAKESSKFLPIITISYTLIAIAMLPYTIAIANGNTKINNILGLCSLFFTIPGYLIFVKSHGAVGTAFVFCIIQFFVTIFYYVIVYKKYISIYQNVRFIKLTLLPILISFLLAFSFFYFFGMNENNRLFGFLMLSAFILATTFCTILFLKFNMVIHLINKALV